MMTGVYTRDALYKTAKTHSKRATRLHSCESICVIYYFRTLYYVKGRVHGLAHAHESKCCFSPVYVVASMQAILFHNIVKEPIRSE